MTDSTFPGATPSDRFFIDDRVGCIAVRDRQRTDPEYPGLHWDTDGVVWYQHGVSGRNGWFVPPEMKEAAQKECARLNAEQASCDALKAEVQRLREAGEAAKEAIQKLTSIAFFTNSFKASSDIRVIAESALHKLTEALRVP